MRLNYASLIYAVLQNSDNAFCSSFWHKRKLMVDKDYWFSCEGILPARGAKEVPQ